MVTNAGAVDYQNYVVNQSVGLSGRVANAIKQASSKTGVEFSYLLNKASQESSFDPNAKSSSSSATGLFQFIEQTWLRVVKAYGSKYGLDQVANRISIDDSGVASVSDSQSRYAILNLRSDPKVSAEMAAELANENKERLQKSVGGKIGSTELYLAHFLGAGGAAAFIREMRENPNAKAASVLPTAASANKNVFYDTTTGEARTLGQIYKKFAKKFDGNSIEVNGTVQMASATKAGSDIEIASSYLPASTTNTFMALPASNSATTAQHYASSALSRLSNETANSYFTTMMLSQMSIDSFGDIASPTNALFGKENRKNIAAVYGLNSQI